MTKQIRTFLMATLSALLVFCLCACSESSDERKCREDLEAYLMRGQSYYYTTPYSTWPAVWLEFYPGEKKFARMELASYGKISAYDEFEYTVSGKSLGTISTTKYVYNVGSSDSTHKALTLMRSDKIDSGCENGCVLEWVDGLLLSSSSAENQSDSGAKSPKNNSCDQSIKAEKDELITEIDGKSVWKVQAVSSSIHFTGSFTGQGYFGITLLDSNQDFEELVCNEIGDHELDKTVPVKKGSIYYIKIECSRGNWTVSWSGTGGK